MRGAAQRGPEPRGDGPRRHGDDRGDLHRPPAHPRAAPRPGDDPRGRGDATTAAAPSSTTRRTRWSPERRFRRLVALSVALREPACRSARPGRPLPSRPSRARAPRRRRAARCRHAARSAARPAAPRRRWRRGASRARRSSLPSAGEPSASVTSASLALPPSNDSRRTKEPTLTASSTRAVIRCGVETLTSTPHWSLNIHSFFGLLTRATTRGTPNSCLASSETTRLSSSSPVTAATMSACRRRRGRACRPRRRRPPATARPAVVRSTWPA